MRPTLFNIAITLALLVAFYGLYFADVKSPAALSLVAAAYGLAWLDATLDKYKATLDGYIALVDMQRELIAKLRAQLETTE